jgi:hypothetical protein
MIICLAYGGRRRCLDGMPLEDFPGGRRCVWRAQLNGLITDYSWIGCGHCCMGFDLALEDEIDMEMGSEMRWEPRWGKEIGRSLVEGGEPTDTGLGTWVTAERFHNK